MTAAKKRHLFRCIIEYISTLKNEILKVAWKTLDDALAIYDVHRSQPPCPYLEGFYCTHLKNSWSKSNKHVN